MTLWNGINMISETNVEKIEIANIFNHYILAQTIHALDDIGVFNKLNEGLKSIEQLSSKEVCNNKLSYLLYIVARYDFIKTNNDLYFLTAKGKQLIFNLGFFNWAIGGYGKLFNSINKIVKGEDISWKELRNCIWVAKASDQCNQSLMKQIVFNILDEIPFRYIADIGCGNAGRLIDICHRYHSVSGLGIDIDMPSIELALNNVSCNNLSHRIQIEKANILSNFLQESAIKIKNHIDLVTCFMMLHDLLNAYDADHVFIHIKKVFPNAKYFLFADTTKEESIDKPESIFSLGFETVHQMMDIKLFSKQHYIECFLHNGFIIKECYNLQVPNTYAFLLERAD